MKLAIRDNDIENAFEKKFGFQRHRCDECGVGTQLLVQIGAELDYESNTAWLCKVCLDEACKLILEGEKWLDDTT